MSTLNDSQKLNEQKAKDFARLQHLIWQAQEHKISDFVLLSYGAYGLYTYRLLNAPNLEIHSNGENTGRKMRHFVITLTEQEDSTILARGLRTGREFPSTGVRSVPKPATQDDALATLCALVENWPNADNVTSVNYWSRLWTLVLADKLSMLSKFDKKALRNEYGFADEKKWNFAFERVLTHTPEMLRQQWLETRPTQPEVVQPVKAKNGKIKHEIQTGQTALAVALENAGKIA